MVTHLIVPTVVFIFIAKILYVWRIIKVKDGFDTKKFLFPEPALLLMSTKIKGLGQQLCFYGYVSQSEMGIPGVLF